MLSGFGRGWLLEMRLLVESEGYIFGDVRDERCWGIQLPVLQQADIFSREVVNMEGWWLIGRKKVSVGCVLIWPQGSDGDDV